MKKFAIILLFAALIVASVALVACSVDQDTCDHQWGEWVDSVAATCTAEGEQTRTCSVCKKQETQTVDALGHQILDDTGVQKSCKGVNLSAGVNCSRCNELLTGNALVAVLDHKGLHTDAAVEATCADPGLTEGQSCSDCGTVFVEQEVVEALGHRMLRTLKAVAPTCTETGLTEGKACLNCGSVTVEQEVVPALGHKEVAAAATDATCTEPAYSAGTVCDRCGTYLSGHVAGTPALGHDTDELNYFTYSECNRCGMYVKAEGANPFETIFEYDFDDAKKEEIEIAYNTVKEAIDDTTVSGEDFDDLFEIYDGYVGYIQAQYQFARIINDISYSATTRAELAAIGEYYNLTIFRYYTLFKEIYESEKSAYFFQDWSSVEIEYVLGLADSYDLDNRNAVDEILDAYEDLLGSWKDTKANQLKLFDLYSQLVEANNKIATTAGYDNYMEYAYERVYGRDYTPSDVAAMRAYVKEYIGPLLADVADAYKAWSDSYSARGGWSSRAAQLYYSQFGGAWMWRNPNDYLSDAERLSMVLNSRNSIADYFTFLSDGDVSVDFYGALENLFESGTFFLGANTNITAYTWYVYSTGTPILVFGGDDSYQDAFTFIHEFGHYYQFVHNGLLGVPMDHDETQSQGNEMLFLAWLAANMPNGVEEGFEIMELEQLVNMLGSIVLSTAVDEFEYLVYTGATTFNGQPIATVELSDGTEVIDYATLYELILQSYWDEIGDWFNTSYWMYVTFDNAAYYISYAMSALPCIELYAKAGNDGLDAARASYLKLFTFSSNDAFMAQDEFNDWYVTATYEQILNWAGLNGPFQENLYRSIQTFFASR